MEVFFKYLATAGVGCARKQILRPVVAHPGDHEFAIDRRLGTQHKIYLQRLVNERRIVDVAFELLLESVDKARPE